MDLEQFFLTTVFPSHDRVPFAPAPKPPAGKCHPWNSPQGCSKLSLGPIFVTKHRLLDFGQPSQNGEAGRWLFSSHQKKSSPSHDVYDIWGTECGAWSCKLRTYLMALSCGWVMQGKHQMWPMLPQKKSFINSIYQLLNACVLCVFKQCVWQFWHGWKHLQNATPIAWRLLVAIHEHEESVTSCHGRSRMGNSMGRSSNSPTLPPTLRWEIALNQQQLLNILRCLTKSKEKQLRVEGFHPLPYSKQP